MSTQYVLEVTYSLKDHALGAPDDKVSAILGCADGGGFGFEQRDVSWYFQTEKRRNNAVKKVKALKIQNIEVNVSELEE